MNTPHTTIVEELDLWKSLVARELKTEQPRLERDMGLGLKASILKVNSQPNHPQKFATSALSHSLCHSSDFHWESFEKLLELGVYDFIVDPFLLGWTQDECSQFVSQYGPKIKSFKGRVWGVSLGTQVGSKVIDAQKLTRWGGHGVHEIGYLLHQLIDHLQKDQGQSEVALSLEMETDFFKSIAKKRALSLMIESVLVTLNQIQMLPKIKIMARSPWRSFTAFDYHSNILRSTTALAAAYVSGSDIVESLPFDLLIESNSNERAQADRLAKTSQLVLQNESHLSEVIDPAYGSYSLEELTQIYVTQGWSFMQSLQAGVHTDDSLKDLAQKNWSEIQDQFYKRKKVQTGVNDFAQADASVKILERWKRADHVRLARQFEELRLSVKTRYKVHLAIIGNYASLQARLNFTKNYFELLGLEVVEQVFSNPKEAESWLKQALVAAWVSADEVHSECFKVNERTYVAGKSQVKDCRNLFQGQNVFEELQDLASWLSKSGGRV